MIERRNFPSILQDNEMVYLGHIKAVIESVDMDAHTMITKKNTGINFRIAPSQAINTNVLIEQLNTLHKALGIKVVFAKSIKTSFNISFDILI